MDWKWLLHGLKKWVHGQNESIKRVHGRHVQLSVHGKNKVWSSCSCLSSFPILTFRTTLVLDLSIVHRSEVGIWIASMLWNLTLNSFTLHGTKSLEFQTQFDHLEDQRWTNCLFYLSLCKFSAYLANNYLLGVSCRSNYLSKLLFFSPKNEHSFEFPERLSSLFFLLLRRALQGFRFLGCGALGFPES